MTFQHLPDNPRDKARAWNIPLGVAGFRYADLNRVRRLEALDRAFLAALRETEPGLDTELAAYRARALPSRSWTSRSSSCAWEPGSEGSSPSSSGSLPSTRPSVRGCGPTRCSPSGRRPSSSGGLRQNCAAEKLTSLWLDHLFEQREVQAV